MAAPTNGRDQRTTSLSPRPGYDGERRTRTSNRLRTCARLAVRSLLVSGFAGAAWLLSSSAAYAAESERPATSAGSAQVSVPSWVEPEVNGALEPDDAPGTVEANGATATMVGSTKVRPDHLQRLRLRGMLNRHLDPDAATSVADRSVRGERTRTVESIRTMPEPVTPEPVTPEPVTPEPVTPVQAAPTAEPDGTSDEPPTAVQDDQSAGDATTSVTAVADRKPAATVHNAGNVGAPRARVAKPRAGSRHPAVSGQSAVRTVHGTDLRGTRNVPLPRPEPAPAPACPVPGFTTGVSSSWAGPTHDRGAFDLIPAFFATASVRGERPARAVDVAVRGVFEEDPTVSPD